MSEQAENRFDQWCIVEVMGHSRYAGRVTEQAIGGASFVRVDVPEVKGDFHGEPRPAFTKLLGSGSIFAITPCTEEAARLVMEQGGMSTDTGWSKSAVVARLKKHLAKMLAEHQEQGKGLFEDNA